MKSSTPSHRDPARTQAVSAVKKSPAWWLWSLTLHAVALGALYLLFPYKEFVKPEARRKVGHPLVDRKILEATTKRIEEKQAEEMARKLLKLNSLTAEIQQTEKSQRTSYASFKDAITELSPELAIDLAAVARQKFDEYLLLLQAEQASWEAYMTEDNQLNSQIAAQSATEIKSTLARYEKGVGSIIGLQDNLNYGQAGLLDIQQQIIDQLGFLKAEKPVLVEQQSAMVPAWSRTLAMGSDYSANFKPLTDLYGGSSRIINKIIESERNRGRAQESIEKLAGRVEQRTEKITETQRQIETLTTQKAAMDAADKKKITSIERKISDLQKSLSKDERDQIKDQEDLTKATASVETLTKLVKDLRQEFGEVIPQINAARKALIDARQTYMALMQKTLEQQKSLDAELTDTLAPTEI